MTRTGCVRLAVVMAAAVMMSATAAAQTAGSYTAAQAEAGRAVFDRSCATCHMTDLSGAFEAPELAGPNFQLAWGARPVGELFDRYCQADENLGDRPTRYCGRFQS